MSFADDFTEDELNELEGMFPGLDEDTEAHEEERAESTPPNTPPKEEKAKPEKTGPSGLIGTYEREITFTQEANPDMKKGSQKQLNGDAADPPKESAAKKSAEDLELEYALLRSLGYDEYDDREAGKGLKFKLKLPTSILEEEALYPKVWITRKYSEENPNGRFSAVPMDENGRIVSSDSGGKPAFLAREDCMKLPPIRNFYLYRKEGKVPPTVVVGRLVEVRGDSRTVEILGEQGEEPGLRISYPAKLIHKNENKEWFVPASLNVADSEGKARMMVPRMLIIENYKTDEKRLLASGPMDHQERAAAPPKPAAPATEKPPTKRTMAEATKALSEPEHPGEPETYAELMRECLCEGVDCVDEILAKEYHINDEVKADLALRIAQSLFIDVGKNRRTPARY